MHTIIIATVLGIFLAGFAGAQSLDSVKPIKDIRQGTKAEMQKAKDEFRAMRQEAQKELKAKKTELQTMVKEKMDTAKTEIKTKGEELQKKIISIKNPAKQQILAKVYDQVNKLNEKVTTELTDKVNRIQDSLDRVESRADKGQANGLDVLGVRTAITSAETAIATAKSAIEVQAGKTYTFTVESEATLKTTVGVARKALETDIKSVRDQVKAARAAVRNAVEALAKVPKVNEVEVQ